MNDYDEALRAEGAINIAVLRLLERYPFHARILEQFKIRARPEVGTMGVAVAGDDLMLYHNPEFVLSLPPEQLQGVLLHEVHHVLLGHVLADPVDFPDEWARTVAEEVSVNEFVKEPLPSGAIVLGLFPSLPPMESTQQRYDRLAKVRRRWPIHSPAGGDPIEKVGTGGTTVDDHSVWAEARQDSQRSRDVIRDAVQQAVLEVNQDQVPRDLLEGLGMGLTPSTADRQLGDPTPGHLDWRRRLRRYVGQSVEVRPVFNRPPRRHPAMAGILPGRRRPPTKPRIMAVIDTSGSITGELLRMIDGELARLAKGYAVTVVECDAAIHAVYPYRSIKKVRGGGGTDLRPPFKKDFLREHRPDLVVYFTDGFGEAPAKPPRVEVLWCLTPEGERPAGWGKTILMGQQPTRR